MPQDCWRAIQSKLESAQNHLLQVIKVILPPPMPAHYVAIQSSGAIVSNPNWRVELHSHLTGFLVDCRSIPDVIQSYCGAYTFGAKTTWLSKLPPDEMKRRVQFQHAFTPLYHKFRKLPLSRARVDTVHGRGLPDIWVRKSGKLYSLQNARAIENAFTPGSGPSLPLAMSIPSSRWAATLPPHPVLYLPSDFFFKTAGRRYKPLFPECETYLRRTGKFMASACRISEKVHNGYRLTQPPRTGR
jgi:hypothetical protein